MPELLWHDTNILETVPAFGVRLMSALQVPEFVSQFLQSGYVQDGQGGFELFPLSPLDDLKAWLRALPAGPSGELEELSDLLLGLETEARKQAEIDGEVFDLEEFELEQLDGDDTWETFEPEILRRVLELVLDQSDDLAPQIERESGYPFFLSVGFNLPRPEKHPYLKAGEIQKAMEKFSPGKAVSLDSQAVQGALNLDFYTAEPHRLARDAENGVVRLDLEDPRSGDKVKVQASLAYPLKAEGYFLDTFDAISKRMRLKD